MSIRPSVPILIFTAGLLWLPSMAPGTGTLHPVTARFDDETTTFTAGGTERVEMRELRVTETGALAKPMSYRILVIFEPQSGAFSWAPFTDYPEQNAAWQLLAFKTYRASFLKDDRLVIFSAGRGPGPLYIQDLGVTASSLADAETKALDAAAKLDNPPGSMDAVQPTHVLPLANLGRDFIIPPDDPGLGQTPKVVGVQWDGERWTVTLKARWTESIVLDADYKILSMNRIDRK